MKNTTLIYLKKDRKYLMMLRNRKENDANADKWIGIGGRIEEGETPMEGALRELKEETGITGTELRFRGIVMFINTVYETEYMFLYTSDITEKIMNGEYQGEKDRDTDVPFSCDEGELHWVGIDEVEDLNLWEGDRYFLKLLKEDAPPFFMTLKYDGDELLEHSYSYI